MLSGVKPFWLIATVKSRGHFRLPEFICTQQKVGKDTGTGGLNAILSWTFKRKENLQARLDQNPPLSEKHQVNSP